MRMATVANHMITGMTSRVRVVSWVAGVAAVVGMAHGVA